MDTISDLLRFIRGIQCTQSCACRSFIDQIDGLIRQISVIDITAGQSDSSLNGLRGDLHMVMILIFSFDALQNTDRLFLCRFFHSHRLESALQGRILLNILAVFRNGGGTNQLDLSTGQGRLHDIGSVNGAFRTSGTNDRMKFIQE